MTILPERYQPALGLYETQKAIGLIKNIFQVKLCAALHLKRVTAPLFVDPATGLNDDLNGVERPVGFDIPAVGIEGQVVHSLAKWKRLALHDYNFFVGDVYKRQEIARRELTDLQERCEKQLQMKLSFGEAEVGALGQVSQEQKAVYDTVLKAHRAVIDGVKPGMVCFDVDKIARDIIEKDYPGTFGHGLGHGVGFEIHEWPRFCLLYTSQPLPARGRAGRSRLAAQRWPWKWSQWNGAMLATPRPAWSCGQETACSVSSRMTVRSC